MPVDNDNRVGSQHEVMRARVACLGLGPGKAQSHIRRSLTNLRRFINIDMPHRELELQSREDFATPRRR